MKKTILTLILILTTSLVSISQALTYTVNGDTITTNEFSLNDTCVGLPIKFISSDLLPNIVLYNVNGTNYPISEIFNPVVGNYIIYFIDNNGNNGQIGFTLNIIECGDTSTASINEREIEINELIAYPNPTIGDMTIAFNTNKTKTPIYIFSLNGQLVYQDNESRMIGTNECNIDVSILERGIYFVEIGNKRIKLIIGL